MNELLQMLKRSSPSTYQLATRIRLTDTNGPRVARRREYLMGQTERLLMVLSVVSVTLGLWFSTTPLLSGNYEEASLYWVQSLLIAFLVIGVARGVEALREHRYPSHLFGVAEDEPCRIFLPSVRQSSLACQWEAGTRAMGRKLLYADYLVMVELCNQDTGRSLKPGILVTPIRTPVFDSASI